MLESCCGTTAASSGNISAFLFYCCQFPKSNLSFLATNYSAPCDGAGEEDPVFGATIFHHMAVTGTDARQRFLNVGFSKHHLSSSSEALVLPLAPFYRVVCTLLFVDLPAVWFSVHKPAPRDISACRLLKEGSACYYPL